MSKSDTLTTEQAAEVLNDLITQLESRGDELLEALVERRKLVGPLMSTLPRVRGERHSLRGPVGRVRVPLLAGEATWELTPLAHGNINLPEDQVRRGQAATMEAADAAMCQALRELGWTISKQPEVWPQWPETPPVAPNQDLLTAFGAGLQGIQPQQNLADAFAPDDPLQLQQTSRLGRELTEALMEALNRWFNR